MKLFGSRRKKRPPVAPLSSLEARMKAAEDRLDSLEVEIEKRQKTLDAIVEEGSQHDS